jgi:hypothetical protein
VHAPPEVPALYVPLYGAAIADKKRANFAGMLGAMDQGVGASGRRGSLALRRGFRPS